MKPLKLEILILSQSSRAPFLKQLLMILGPQIEKADGEAVARIRTFDPSMTLGENRTVMQNKAESPYIVFIDDDDFVPAYYLETILPLLDGVVDQIGYEVRTYADFKVLGRTLHSLKFGKWDQDGKTYWRNISHINPIKRELAIQVPMVGTWGEDCAWAQAMTKLDIVKTETYVDRIMYHYLWRTTKRDTTDAQDPRRLEMLKQILLADLRAVSA